VEVKEKKIEKEDKVEKNSTDEREQLESITSFLRESIPAPEGSIIDVKHLWGKFYRINYWREDKIRAESKLNSDISMNRVIESKFVRVEIVIDGYIFEDYDA
jgi:hypothetical protein